MINWTDFVLFLLFILLGMYSIYCTRILFSVYDIGREMVLQRISSEFYIRISLFVYLHVFMFMFD